MAIMASIIFALSLNPTQLEPVVEWVFSADACEQCSLAHTEVLAQFIRDGDRIYINHPERNKSVTRELQAKLKEVAPGFKVELVDRRQHEMVTGWLLVDPVTKEEIGYQVKSEHYGAFRSQTLLQIFRDPN